MQHRVIVLGAGGQLGRELLACVPPDVHCVALGRDQLDVGDPLAIEHCLGREQPQVLINAAAYTAVDRAESEESEALRSNGEGPGHLARACREAGARLVHLSTDFVFDGRAGTPYLTDATPAPLGAYGRSKLAGEQAVQAELPEAMVLRTAWVYSRFGGNFVKTMLRLMAERDSLSVVADQVGSPTWAQGLAGAVWAAATRPDLRGMHHWTDAGVCSWYDFAVAIMEEACALGLLSRPVQVTPCTTADYPTPAPRPAYSVLAKEQTWQALGLEPLHWRVQLRAMLRELKEQEQ